MASARKNDPIQRNLNGVHSWPTHMSKFLQNIPKLQAKCWTKNTWTDVEWT